MGAKKIDTSATWMYERTIRCFMLWFAAVGWSLNAFVIVRVLIKSYRFFLKFFFSPLLLLLLFHSLDSFIDAWREELSSRVYFFFSFSFTKFSTYHFDIANAIHRAVVSNRWWPPHTINHHFYKIALAKCAVLGHASKSFVRFYHPKSQYAHTLYGQETVSVVSVFRVLEQIGRKEFIAHME